MERTATAPVEVRVSVVVVVVEGLAVEVLLDGGGEEGSMSISVVAMADGWVG